jgi:hypothetical protein
MTSAAPASFSLATLPQGTPPVLTMVIEDATRDALDRHGLAAFMMPREAAIAHGSRHRCRA